MIIAQNNKPTIQEFALLMQKTDLLLNQEAKKKEDYYQGRNGTLLEDDVFDALLRTSLGSPFEGSIQLVSGAAFPDIVANRFYGVEVKSTKNDSWKSIGSSILESTRINDVERIYMTFGKLGKPVAFMSRPYEEVLSGISVTHYPRYQIDMELHDGETIFDKIGIEYDELRLMDNPVAPVAAYYKKHLRPGESLWWVQDINIEETSAPPIIRLWTSLSPDEKRVFTVKGYSLFPEILSPSSTTKYQRFALWLASDCSIVNTNIRDQFSAGGKVDINTGVAIYKRMPAAFGRIQKSADLIKETIEKTAEETLKEFWGVSRIQTDRIDQWCKLASAASSESSENRIMVYKMLTEILQM